MSLKKIALQVIRQKVTGHSIFAKLLIAVRDVL